jgi:hypothetical protein
LTDNYKYAIVIHQEKQKEKKKRRYRMTEKMVDVTKLANRLISIFSKAWTYVPGEKIFSKKDTKQILLLNEDQIEAVKKIIGESSLLDRMSRALLKTAIEIAIKNEKKEIEIKKAIQESGSQAIQR